MNLAHGPLVGMEMLVIILIVLAEVKSAPAQDEKTLRVFESEWPAGDPRRCQGLSKLSNQDVQRFEVLPGIGWDNLRNLETGLVVSYNFSNCKVTDDGNYLIPNDVYTIPLKTSKVETFAEIIESWQEARSITSDTINIDAGFQGDSVSINGKFSNEHEQLKSTQIGDESSTVRVQLRYHRYEVKLQPDPQLSPQFKSRLLTIAAQLELNQTEQARYSGQLLVRDFGTHVLTSVTAGAGLVKDDYVSRKFMSSSSTDKKKILVSASASFSDVFKFNASFGFSQSSQSTDSNTYNNIMTHSFIKTFGGPIVKTDMSVDDWVSQLDANLVAMDRAGDPLNFFVTRQTLPKLPPTSVSDVEKIVRQSIETYYEMNTIPGCTKLDSPNFSFSANVDDGSCNTQYTNLTFGGIYQICQLSGQYLYSNPCSGIDQVNPKTGAFSCPSSYEAVQLLQARKPGITEELRHCQKCGFLYLSTCCDTTLYQATAMYTTYWCAASGPIAPQSGYLFGGFYSSSSVNPTTGTTNCPKGYYALRLLYSFFICLSDDYEQGAGLSVPFGGFFSCQSGNPLSVVHPVGVNSKLHASNSLRSFVVAHIGGENLLQECPNGYSQHIVTVESGCAVYYCTRTNYLSGPMLPPVKRPPFTTKPAPPADDKHELVMFNVDTQTWVKDENVTKEKELNKATEQRSAASNQQQSQEISPGAAAAIATCGTIAFVAVAMLITLAVYKPSRRLCAANGKRLTEQTLESRPPNGIDDTAQ